ncbi:hypothetical protein SV7mr_13050 [Stieleria bergensis]|uniref:Uncharacterized protein n=1 Tax=Stieleria bergensis TaxID=2528025 RepID=A0A517SRP8_9BACT|nr:hypothetical protein SV7mr_13050 [Planctomycetes bacterium SV_7m_r]
MRVKAKQTMVHVASLVRDSLAVAPGLRNVVMVAIACVGYQASAQVVTPAPYAPMVANPVVAPVMVPVFPERRASNLRDLRRMRRAQLPLVYPTNQMVLTPAVPPTAAFRSVQQTSYSLPVGSSISSVYPSDITSVPAPGITPAPVAAPVWAPMAPVMPRPVPVIPARAHDVFVPFF